jgi:hypothetical protein
MKMMILQAFVAFQLIKQKSGKLSNVFKQMFLSNESSIGLSRPGPVVFKYEELQQWVSVHSWLIMNTHPFPVITLARIFSNKESAFAYLIGARQLFNSLEKINGQPIYFHHIHQQGIGAVTVDMDTKQAKGEWSIMIDHN